MSNPGNASRNPKAQREKLRGGKMAELPLESRTLRIPGSSFRFPFSAANLRWFRIYIVSALGVVVTRNLPRGAKEPRGTPRNDRMAELRIESGIFGIPGSAFCFLSSYPLLRRFRVFSIAALGDGCQWPPPRNFSRNPHGTLRNGKMAEIRQESGILRFSGPVFGFSSVATQSAAVSRI